MNTFSLVFLAALVITTAFRVWLAWRHIGYVAAHRDRVPPAFTEKVTLQAHQKAGDYTVAKTRLALTELIVDALLVLAFTLGGGLEWIDQTLRGMHFGWPGLGIWLIVSVTIISGLALGVDAAAHEGALRGAASTLAVVGTGMDRVYPARNRDLAHA